MRTLFVLAILTVLMAQMPVMAATNDFSVGISAPDSFLVNTTDTATIHITNNGTTDWFKVYVLSIETWAWIPTWRLKVDSGATADVLVYISPPADAQPKIYNFPVTVIRESSDVSIERQLLVQVTQNIDASLTNLTTSCTECTGRVDFSLDVQNVGTEPFTGAITADLAGVTRNYQLEITLGSAQHVSDSFDLIGFQPGNYQLKLNLSSATRNIQSVTKSFTITTVENVAYNRSMSSSPFGNSVVLTATNLGNVPQTATIRSQITQAWWSTYAGPQPTEITDGEYVWVAELAGGGQLQIAYTEVVWPLPAIIIALLIVGIIYYVQFSALTVKKSAVGRTIVVPGRDIGIALTVKNARRAADTLIVRDIVPSAFSVSHSGALKPMMRKTGIGTELVWKLSNIGAGEERVINYKIRPNVQVYGGISLAPAKVRVMQAGTCKAERASNSVVLEGAPKGGVRKLPVEVEK